MRMIFTFFFCFSILFNSLAQVTNLSVNGDTSDFSIVSGDQISWSYSVPAPGDTTMLEFWIDSDSNQVITEEDVPWVYFYQIDGPGEGQNGPPDIDGEINGQVSFQQEIGLAPGNYILSFKNNDSSVTISGTVTNHPLPFYTISGSVFAPEGLSQENIMVSLESNNENGTFWAALTDSNGNYTICMSYDSSNAPWNLMISNKFVFKSAIVSPDEIRLTLDSSTAKDYSENNFTITAASAEINGNIVDEDGNVLVNTSVYFSSFGSNFNRHVNSDNKGNYYLGLLSTELPQLNLSISSGNWMDSSTVKFNYNLPVINTGDTLTQHITLYKVNSSIEGRLTFDGGSPGVKEVFAECPDTGYIRTVTDEDGYFRFYVSDKIYIYVIKTGQHHNGYNSDSIIVHPGDQNANLNLTATDVKYGKAGIPDEFSLSQNYPNPFNPVTTIKYQVPEHGFVTLKIFDLLGNEIKTLVSEEKKSGTYELKFDASNLTSGIYFYKMNSAHFTECKKMILIK